MRMPPHVATPDASIKQRLDALTTLLHPHPDERQKYFFPFEVLNDGNLLLLREFRRSDAVLDERVDGIRVFPTTAAPGIYTSDGVALSSNTYAVGWRMLVVDYRAQMVLTAIGLPMQQSEVQPLPPSLRANKLTGIGHEWLRHSAIEAVLTDNPMTAFDFLMTLHKVHREKTHLVHGAELGSHSYSFLNL